MICDFRAPGAFFDLSAFVQETNSGGQAIFNLQFPKWLASDVQRANAILRIPCLLRDFIPVGGFPIHERFLRYVWTRGLFRSSELRTTDGRAVTILAPGKLVDGAGPDVRDAVIKIGPTTFAGDVEFHQDSVGWTQHDHHLRPSYNRVILHVVFNGSRRHRSAITKSRRTVPLLVLLPYLSAPVNTLWDSFLQDERTAASLACFGMNRSVPQKEIQLWLHRMDIERLELRILRLQERLRELVAESTHKLAEPLRNYGSPREEGFPEEIPAPYPELSRGVLADRRLWEQVLYEGIMEGLGYSRNRIPFVRLAKAVSLNFVRSRGLQNNHLALTSLLFGISGLLPTARSLNEKASRIYVRSLSRGWKQFRKDPSIKHIHPAEWQFSPTRPHNFPTLRMSAAPGIIRNILTHEMFRRAIGRMKSPAPAEEIIRDLQQLLLIDSDEFWVNHYHFDRATKRPIRALGISRINDILVNTFFPLSLLYARVFTDVQVREGVLALRRTFPVLSENSSTRVMNRELFYGKKALGTLPLQQGSIQLYRYYCTKGRCGECEIGRRVLSGVSPRR